MEVSLVAARDPFLGRSLAGRYRVDRKLGEGGMGAVYRGEHLLIQRPVAIKILHPQLATNADVVRRFLNEARVVTAIRHENIVDVTDMGQLEDGTLFMVLELLEGRDFADLVEEVGPLPFARVIHILDQMCAALEVAHERGIVHRDLKPENVFLVPRSGDPDFVKILDFGIAKIIDGDGSGMRTQTGMAIGTMHYMPPEQVQGGKDLDHRADIYALGVILFRALGGRFPYDSDTLASLLVKILLDPVPPLRKVRPDAPAELEAIVMRCLSKRAADRYASCAELRAALRALSFAVPSGSGALPFAGTAHASTTGELEAARVPSWTHAFAEVERPSVPSETTPPLPTRGVLALPAIVGIAMLGLAALGTGLGVYAMRSEEPASVAAPDTRASVAAPDTRASAPTSAPAPEPAPAEPFIEPPPRVEPEPGPEPVVAEVAPEPPVAPAPASEPVAMREPRRRREPLAQPLAQPLGPIAQPLAPPPAQTTPSTSTLGGLGQGTVRRIP